MGTHFIVCKLFCNVIDVVKLEGLRLITDYKVIIFTELNRIYEGLSLHTKGSYHGYNYHLGIVSFLQFPNLNRIALAGACSEQLMMFITLHVSHGYLSQWSLMSILDIDSFLGSLEVIDAECAI